MGTLLRGQPTLAVVVTALLVTPPAAGAATLKVTNTDNRGPGSLRHAINKASHETSFPGEDTIEVKAAGTIRLRSELSVRKGDLRIVGPGPHKLTVSGGNQDPLVDYTFGIRNSTLHLSGVSLVGTYDAAYVYRKTAALILTDSIVRDNVTGIFNVDGSTELRRVTIKDNRGTGPLGGIGIRSLHGPIEVSRSLFSGNRLGIEEYYDDVTVSVERSTFSNNSRGAIKHGFGALSVTQSTLSGNDGQASIRTSGPTSLASTIITDSGAANCSSDNAGSFTSNGHNIADDDSCNLTATGDQPSTEPRQRPLDRYGEPTETFALRPSSPAVDAGFADGATVDQRGLPRIVDYPDVAMADGGDSSDIGSFELQLP